MSLRPSAGGVMLAGVLVLAAGETAFGAAARPTDPPPASARTVPVSASVSVCPTAPGQSQAKGTSTILAVGALPEVVLPQGAALSGTPRTASASTGSPVRTTVPTAADGRRHADDLCGHDQKGITAPTVVRARGGRARGRRPQLTRIPGRTAPCPDRAGLPGSDRERVVRRWLRGRRAAHHRRDRQPGQRCGGRGRPRVAERGQVPAPSGRGIAIPAHGHRTLRVDVLAPETSRVVLNVIMRPGARRSRDRHATRGDPSARRRRRTGRRGTRTSGGRPGRPRRDDGVADPRDPRSG